MTDQFDARYTSLSAAMRPDHIYFAYDTRGRLLFLSPSVRDVLGHEVEHFRRNCWSLMADDAINDRAELLIEQSLQGHSATAYPVLYEHKNGNYVLLEATHWPVYNASGEVVRVEGFLRDTSEEWSV